MNDTRNYGLDILKIVSMVFVVILHALGQGGVLEGGAGINKSVATALFFITSAAVDIFALVTGYVSYSEKSKPVNLKRLFAMWFQVVFYGLLFTTLGYFLFPGQVELEDFIRSALPITRGIYWYFISYFIVYLLAPVSNAAVRALAESTLRKVFILIIIFFSVVASFSYYADIVRSHSFTWILILYFLGAIIRKCRLGDKLPSAILIIGYVACIFLNCFCGWYGESILEGDGWYIETLSDYIFPTTLIQAICLLILFKRIKVGSRVSKILRFTIPCVFATYLINTHDVIYGILMDGAFTEIARKNVFLMVIFLIVYGIVFVICSCLFDALRILFFKIIRIDKLSGVLEKLARIVTSKFAG